MVQEQNSFKKNILASMVQEQIDPELQRAIELSMVG